MLAQTWDELDYHLDVCRATSNANIEKHQTLKILYNLPLHNIMIMLVKCFIYFTVLEEYMKLDITFVEEMYSLYQVKV